MNLTASPKLLRDYADHGDEAAFRKLVDQYINLVYSVAVRRVGGDTSLAQDVTQTVFTDLARKAPSLRDVGFLGGWLHKHTGFVASNMVRSEQRRQIREQEAAQMNATNNSMTVFGNNWHRCWTTPSNRSIPRTGKSSFSDFSNGAIFVRLVPRWASAMMPRKSV
jgi:hypothetical protein